MIEGPSVKFYQVGREADLFRKEPCGGRSESHGRHYSGFQWRDARCRPYERKGGSG